MLLQTRVAFQEKCDVLSGSVCDYEDYFYDGQYDDSPDYFDYNDPGDFDNYSLIDSYPDVYGFIEPDDYELYHDPDDCWVYCVARRDTDGTSYWTGFEDCDGFGGAAVLPRVQ